MDLPETGHDPVFLHEVIEWLAPQPSGTIVDCTLGRGGHGREIAKRLGRAGLLIGLDVDPRNLEFAKSRLADAPSRVRLFHANFAELTDVLREAQVDRVDGILADLGLSTNQLFDHHYGLSFAQDMPLDMRIDPRIAQTAADLVNKLREDELADVLYNLAQERWSRRIARIIAQARARSPITSTVRLAELVRSAVPRRRGAPEKIDPATRTFLALRSAWPRSALTGIPTAALSLPSFSPPRTELCTRPNAAGGIKSAWSPRTRGLARDPRPGRQRSPARCLSRPPPRRTPSKPPHSFGSRHGQEGRGEGLIDGRTARICAPCLWQADARPVASTWGVS